MYTHLKSTMNLYWSLTKNIKGASSAFLSSSQGATPLVSPLNGLWAVENLLPLPPTPLVISPASSNRAPITGKKLKFSKEPE